MSTRANFVASNILDTVLTAAERKLGELRYVLVFLSSGLHMLRWPRDAPRTCFQSWYKTPINIAQGPSGTSGYLCLTEASRYRPTERPPLQPCVLSVLRSSELTTWKSLTEERKKVKKGKKKKKTKQKKKMQKEGEAVPCFLGVNGATLDCRLLAERYVVASPMVSITYGAQISDSDKAAGRDQRAVSSVNVAVKPNRTAALFFSVIKTRQDPSRHNSLKGAMYTFSARRLRLKGGDRGISTNEIDFEVDTLSTRNHAMVSLLPVLTAIFNSAVTNRLAHPLVLRLFPSSTRTGAFDGYVNQLLRTVRLKSTWEVANTRTITSTISPRSTGYIANGTPRQDNCPRAREIEPLE
ncbi:hypothetical protein BC835DRAFT_1310709 [Cytidiella melzeri]|nr:hypothetical protein BC835DRAFT_1310709 [Cytidiella melzeri]